jgi:hypothetical protein
MANQEARKYFSRFSPEQQEEIRQSWGGQDLLQEWYDNAVAAGAVGGQGGSKVPKSGHSGGGTSDATGVRAQAKEQGMSEDFDRFDENTLKEWEQFRDTSCPPKYPYRMDPSHINRWFKGQYSQNACVEKPIDTGGVIQDASGQWQPNGPTGGQRGQGQGGPGQQQPATPPPPTTFGQQLSYTGDPMQDMLIQQFNQRTQSMDPTKTNIFGMGMDREVGGEGLAADTPMKAQALAGGGLWRGTDETFGGFRADKTNVAAQKPKRQRGFRRGRRGRRGAEATMAPSPADIASPPGGAASPTPQPAQVATMSSFNPEGQQNQQQQLNGMQSMMKKRFGGQPGIFGGQQFS